MSISNHIPKQIEDALLTNRPRLPQKRGPACGQLRRGNHRDRGAERRRAGPGTLSPIPIFAKSIPGLSSIRTNTATFYVARPTPVRAPGPVSGN
jgi:hypothetical protein